MRRQPVGDVLDIRYATDGDMSGHVDRIHGVAQTVAAEAVKDDCVRIGGIGSESQP